MSNPIDTLGSVTISSTAPGSLFFYGVYENGNYRIPIENMRKMIGQNVGALAIRSTSYSLSSTGVIPWQAVNYDEDGWWNAASSTILQVPNSFITHVRVYGGVYTIGSNSGVQFRFDKNGGFNSDDASPFMTYSNNGVFRQTWQTPMLSVVSGDYFEMNLTFLTGSRTMLANGFSYFGIQPMRFAE